MSFNSRSNVSQFTFNPPKLSAGRATPFSGGSSRSPLRCE
jgi:hypothetical protein